MGLVNPVQKTTLALTTLVLLALTPELAAQIIDLKDRNSGPADVSMALASWIDLDAPPGRERLATDTILKDIPGWKRDELGNLMLRRGSGSPRRDTVR